MTDDYAQRLADAQKAYDRSRGRVESLTEQRDSEVSRLLEAHGVTQFEDLGSVREKLEREFQDAEANVEESFKEAGI